MQEKYSQNANFILDRLKGALNIGNDAELATFLGVKPQTVSTWRGRNSVNHSLIIAKCDDLDLNYIFGSPSNIAAEPSATYLKKNLIPLYNDVESIGGSAVAANGSESPLRVEYIDAGDWFPGATAAIHHYGDSMKEYPSGCILALKAINDLKDGFVPGCNYVVEYGDDWNRVTKRIQKKEEEVWAYSTNKETYPDGTLIHQPFKLRNIHRAWRVLGSVIKTESSNSVINVIGHTK